MADAAARQPSSGRTSALVGGLARPYAGWLAIILLAMLVETVAGLAAPWPLKIVIDNALAGANPPPWLAGILGPAGAADGRRVAAAAAIGVVLIAIVGGAASYVENYYTESVGQWVANDLRLRLFGHLERLSFTYFDTHRTGVLLSTITDDTSTIQDFVSSSALSILVDMMTI
ncbi:MAG TPA: ABC transporter transmembrane domain-containing protein, partial [Vicinamibacterales bacterium]|nr:ABC transporter transmembrane domain-containing protein [Vicinamibacterales bacterium]